jgi:hypothetical protein
MRINSTFTVLILIVSLFAVSLSAQHQHTTANYLLVEHPERLIVYNRYQQHSTPEEQKLLTPFVPIKILDAEATLNDDFTPCLKVDIQGQIFYLLKNEVFEVPGKKLGTMRVLNRVTVLNDTIRLVSSDITLTIPDQKKSHRLQAGAILERYFQDGKTTFVRLSGQRPEYGWVHFSMGEKTKEYIVLSSTKSIATNVPLSDAIRKRIQVKLIEANKALADLFAYFNTETKTRKIAPQWRLVTFKQQYACILEPTEYGKQYAESSRYLAGDIESILLGTNYGTIMSPGRIEIHSK